MKTRFFIICLAALAALSSCSDVLDVTPEGRKTLDEIFDDPVGAAAYLNTCYGYMTQRGLSMDSWNSDALVGMSDDAWDRDDVEGDQQIFAGPIYNGALSPAKPLLTSACWGTNWSGIRACNVFIQRIPDAPVQAGQPDEKAQWIAEAKVLRAYYLLEMIIRYGGLPILSEPLDINDNCSSLERESFRTCIDQILKDCTEAIDEPSLPWRRTVSSQGNRVTKAIAWGLKSRAITFAASPLWNGGQDYWAEAEQVTKDALQACLDNGYALYTTKTNADFASAFEEYFCSNSDYIDNPRDKETIIESRATSNTRNLHGLPIVNAYKAGLCPTQELVDAFGMQSTGLPVLDLQQPYLDERHLEPNYYPESGYDPEKPYVGRDPRFYATVYYNGSQRRNQQNVMTTVEVFQNGNCGIASNIRQRTMTGYYLKKFDHPLGRSGADQPRRYKMMRLAELYLNYAEAANENGNTQDALDAVNTVRARAAMPPVEPTTQELARLWIRNEFRVEFAIEERRHFDVRRWQEPDGDLAATDRWITGMWPVKKPDATTVDDVTYYRFVCGDGYDPATGQFFGTGRERLCWDNKYLIWPIELNEANRLRGATGENWQNPGW